MPRFGRKVPRLVPLQPPAVGLAAEVDIEAVHNQAHETRAFTKVAQDNSKHPGMDQTADPIVRALLDRFGTHLNSEAQRSYLSDAVASAVRLGLGFAEIEAYAGMAPPGMSDARIWNAVVMTKESFRHLPEVVSNVLFFAVQAGYYVGRNGPETLPQVLQGA